MILGTYAPASYELIVAEFLILGLFLVDVVLRPCPAPSGVISLTLSRFRRFQFVQDLEKP